MDKANYNQNRGYELNPAFLSYLIFSKRILQEELQKTGDLENIIEENKKSGLKKADYSVDWLLSAYTQHFSEYLNQHAKNKNDTSNLVPLKWLNLFPKSVMGGVLGFTYIGDNSMGKRDDLTGDESWEVDIHESIHTPDEYETRRVTLWIMEEPKIGYLN